VQNWLWQVELPVHGLWSSQAKPFAFPVQRPHGILTVAVRQPPGMKQWPALPEKNGSLLLHFDRNCQCANGRRNVAWPLAFVVLLADVIPSVESGVTARPDTGAPAPSSTVTTVCGLTRIVALAQPCCTQSNVELL